MRDGSRQSSASGSGPLRANVNDAASVTMFVTPCFVRPALAVSAAARSLYGPMRTMNGAIWVNDPFSGEPMR